MFKKSTRIITIVMLVAMLLTLFTGVIAVEDQETATEPNVETVEEGTPIVNADSADEEEILNVSAVPTDAAVGTILEANYTSGRKQLTINVVDEGGDVLETQTISVKGGFSIKLSITDINYTLVSYKADGCTYASAVISDRYLSSTALFGSSKSGTITMNVKANAGLYTLSDIIQMNTQSGKQTVKFRLYDTNNKLLDENTDLKLQRVANWTQFDIINADYKIARIETDGCTFAKNIIKCTQNHLEGNFTYNRQGAEIKVFVEKTNGEALPSDVAVDVDRFVNGIISQSLCDKVNFSWTNAGGEVISKDMVGTDFTNLAFKLPKGVDITVTPTINEGYELEAIECANLMKGVTLKKENGKTIMNISKDTLILSVRLSLKGKNAGTGSELPTVTVHVNRFIGSTTIDQKICSKVTFTWQEDGQEKFVTMVGEGFANSSVKIPKGVDITVTADINPGFEFNNWNDITAFDGVKKIDSNVNPTIINVKNDFFGLVALQLHAKSMSDIPTGKTFNLNITRNNTDANGATMSETKNCSLVKFTWKEGSETKTAYMAGNSFGSYNVKLPKGKEITMEAVMNSGYAFDEWRAWYAESSILLDGDTKDISEKNPVTLFVGEKCAQAALQIFMYSQRDTGSTQPGTDPVVETGTLTIEKKIIVTGTDAQNLYNKKYTFQIQSGDLTGSFATNDDKTTVSFENGKAEVTIKGEGSIDIIGLPAGSYNITEADASFKGYKLEVSGTGDTKLDKAGKKVTVTNSYTKETAPEPPVAKDYTVTISFANRQGEKIAKDNERIIKAGEGYEAFAIPQEITFNDTTYIFLESDPGDAISTDKKTVPAGKSDTDVEVTLIYYVKPAVVDPPVTGNSSITVKYLDKNGVPLRSEYIETVNKGDAYNVAGNVPATIKVSGGTWSDPAGDKAYTGKADENVTIVVTYTTYTADPIIIDPIIPNPDPVDPNPIIPDEPVPGGDKPGDGGTDIDDSQVPGADKPSDGGATDIDDGNVPKSDSPATGDNNSVVALVAIMAMAGLAIAFVAFGKKEKESN